MNAFEKISDEKKINMLRIMLLSRFFEEKVNEMFMKGMIHGTTHLGIGQEAGHAAVSSALNEDDWILTTHRGHGHFLGKGGSAESMMAELMGVRDGACLGLGGSMHLADIEHHNMGSSGVVAGAVPIAVGMAFALKYKQSSQIVLSIFGDAASNQGMALESLNLAAVWQVPVLFFCENNMYGMSAPAKTFVAGGDISKRAESFGIKSISVDGNNPIALYDAISDAAQYVRENQSPYLIESKTYRWLGHSKSDLRKYRTKEEEDHWKAKCPILSYEKYLFENGLISIEKINLMKEEAAKEIEDAVRQCAGKGVLSLEEALSCVLCDGGAL